jgi:hypothetical protein
LRSPQEGKLHTVLRVTAVGVALLAFGAGLFGTASPAVAATPCWKQVGDDWSQDGHVDGRYSPACIEKALANVPEDIRAYSDFEEQAKAARLANSRTPQSVGGGADDTQMLQEREPETGPKDETPIQSVLGTHGNNEDSIPIPLLILLGLAGALITAGAAGFGARKLRARRAAR